MIRSAVLVSAVLAATVSALSGQSHEKEAPKPDHVLLLDLESHVFHNTRSLRVLLPPGYHDKQNSSKRYPVFYLNDGYAVFTYWNAEQAVNDLIREKAIEPLIVVGIDNAGEKERANEYLPYPDESLDPPLPHPQGRFYPQFLVEEVIPLINQKFRTKTGAQNTGLGGASYGAYIALYSAINRPDVFGKLLLESTPLFIQDFQILEDVKTAKGLPGRVSIEVGTKETPDEEINLRVGQNAEKLATAMRNTSPQTQVRVVVQKDAEHGAQAWKERLPDALKFLFPR